MQPSSCVTCCIYMHNHAVINLAPMLQSHSQACSHRQTDQMWPLVAGIGQSQGARTFEGVSYTPLSQVKLTFQLHVQVWNVSLFHLPNTLMADTLFCCCSCCPNSKAMSHIMDWDFMKFTLQFVIPPLHYSSASWDIGMSLPADRFKVDK